MESSLAGYRETVIRAFNDIELVDSLSRIALEDLKRAHLNAVVSLCQSLGGGWRKDAG